MVGKRLRVKVIELNRKRNRVILSERVAVEGWGNPQREGVGTAAARLSCDPDIGQTVSGKEGDLRPEGNALRRIMGASPGFQGASLLKGHWERTNQFRHIMSISQCLIHVKLLVRH